MRPALFAPVLVCLLSVIGVCIVLIASILAENMPSPVIIVYVSLSVALICAVTLVLIMRLYRPVGQLDTVMERISPHTKPSDLPDMRGNPGRHVSKASSDIEQLYINHITAVNKEYANLVLMRQAQFKTLQSQINPHFLYNTLESLRGHAIAEGVPEIADMAKTLSQFFRYSISQHGDFVTVEQELSSVRDYFHIQKYRFGDRLNLTVNYDENDPIDKCYMPKLTLQPIVENSILHGFDEKMYPCTVEIRVVMTHSNVLISVRDDGYGMERRALEVLRESIAKDVTAPPIGDARQIEPHKGIALRNVNQRISMLFGAEYGIHITSFPMVGTNVEIVIPRVTNPPELKKTPDS